MAIIKSQEVKIDGGKGDIILNHHSGGSFGDNISITVSANNSLVTQRVSLSIKEATALLNALDLVL